MKTFTEEEVDKLIKAAITETVLAYGEWLEEESEIVDKTTHEKIPNAEIDVLKDSDGKVISKSLTKMVYARLEKHGIKFIQ